MIVMLKNQNSTLAPRSAARSAAIKAEQAPIIRSLRASGATHISSLTLLNAVVAKMSRRSREARQEPSGVERAQERDDPRTDNHKVTRGLDDEVGTRGDVEDAELTSMWNATQSAVEPRGVELDQCHAIPVREVMTVPASRSPRSPTASIPPTQTSSATRPTEHQVSPS